MITFLVVALCLLLGVGVYAGLMGSGILPGRERDETRTFSSGSGVLPRAPQLREMPQGCLIVLILVAGAWFVAWGIVLVLALNLLRSTA
jgi:hypothetical protein